MNIFERLEYRVGCYRTEENGTKHRYHLYRHWDASSHKLAWIMLNPSLGDEMKDDATIRICILHAKKMGYGGIDIYNLFSLVTPTPIVMMNNSAPNGDEADDYLHQCFHKHEHILAAWGEHGNHLDRDQEVLQMAKNHGRALMALKLTRAGRPFHPVRLGLKITADLWIDADGREAGNLYAGV